MTPEQRENAPRFPARLILTTPEHLLAFGLGSGLAPRAPGTVGTVLGVPLFLLFYWLPPLWFAVALAAAILGACWVCGASSRLLGVHDHPGIVADEIVGYCVAALPLLPAWAPSPLPLWAGLLAAFVLFRFFDIVKPWPIRRIDAQVHGGIGIVLDDLIAGLMSAAVLYAGLRLWALGN